ncbi:MAG TPA: SulP family inorganic anion transporter, partial [Arachnia sp.]|nr:SulP family inorganic anion transporter [Arachnia sp.]
MQVVGVDVPLASFRALIPSREDYRGLTKRLPTELVAGLTVGIVALPLALGFGVASGVGAAAGLVTAVVAGLVAAVFGGSHLQVSGPTGAMTVVLLPVVAHYGVDKVPLLAILAGLLVVVMAVTGMGRAVDIIPWPVVEGFTFGIGIIIALQQIPLALDTPKGESESTLVSSWQTLLATDWAAATAPLAVVAGVVAVHLV